MSTPINAETMDQLITQLASLSHQQILVSFAALTLTAILLRVIQVSLMQRKVTTEKEKAERQNLIATQTMQGMYIEQLQSRLQTLEAYLDRLSAKQEQLQTNAVARKHRLQDAIECAEQGLDRHTLVKRAGVSGSEARLIGELYGIKVA